MWTEDVYWPRYDVAGQGHISIKMALIVKRSKWEYKLRYKSIVDSSTR